MFKEIFICESQIYTYSFLLESSSELSGSSASSVEVKRAKRINYFLGEGEKKWKPKQELLINNVNVTELFKRFRKHSIAEVEKNGHINPLRILSLSHIFPLNTFDVKKCVTRHFDRQTRKSLKSFASNTKPEIERMSGKAVVYCKNKANKEEEKKEKKNETMMVMVKDLVYHTMHFRATAASSSEATFTEKCLLPIVQTVLLRNANEDMVYAMIDKPESNNMKPDFMIGAKVRTKEVYFFFIEVKRPEATSKYQPEDDYTKLMKEMKCSVDTQLRLGVLNPTSLGVLVEGFKCTLFQMKLVSDGIYMPVAFDRFSLIEEIHQLVNLPSVVEAFYSVKVLIAKNNLSNNKITNSIQSELENFMEDISKKRTKEEKVAGEERVYPSFDTKFESKKTK
ncbi:hypothetical protein BDF21DRAFT_333601 [Thamnidium elegans]|nr:hypothetical protein BDF21DRAFT_333601 [Thamnidium elegans]